jgi:hypothetical protein
LGEFGTDLEELSNGLRTSYTSPGSRIARYSGVAIQLSLAVVEFTIGIDSRPRGDATSPPRVLARIKVALARLLAPLNIGCLGSRAPASLQARGVGAAAGGRLVLSRDTLVGVVEHQRGNCHNDQRA